MRSGGFEVFSVGREAPADFFFFTPCGLGGTSNVDDDDEDEEDDDDIRYASNYYLARNIICSFYMFFFRYNNVHLYIIHVCYIFWYT